MKIKFQKLYSNIAKEVSKMSYARRLQVGAVIVKDDRVISMGYNGMPSGWENDCEYRDYMDKDSASLDPKEITDRWPYEEKEELIDPDDFGSISHSRRYNYKTRKEVLHAETNAIAKLARSNESGLGADMFITHAPCMDCAKLIYQSGISRVFYNENYRDDSGIKFLTLSGIKVIKNDE